LFELNQQVTPLKANEQAHTMAITKMESALRRIDRRQLLEDADVSETQLNTLNQTVYELDASLRNGAGYTAAHDVQLESLLQQIGES
jgi:hypothetical protein